MHRSDIAEMKKSSTENSVMTETIQPEIDVIQFVEQKEYVEIECLNTQSNVMTEIELPEIDAAQAVKLKHELQMSAEIDI